MAIETVAGAAADALRSLSPAQLQFLQGIPKAELHAHLNGCIPLHVLQDLAHAHLSASESSAGVPPDPHGVRAGLQKLQRGVDLDELHDFFGLFPAIYALTSSPSTLATAARAVLRQFLDPDAGRPAQAAYLELRTTPRQTPTMSRMEYLETVLGEVERYPAERAALIVSLDRRMEESVAAECVRLAVELKQRGRRVVGVDLCGDPTAGDPRAFAKHFRAAKDAGLGITLHIAETEKNTPEDTLALLALSPDRLGHATFLDHTSTALVHASKTCIEICLSSNLLCKTVPALDAHHVRHHLKHNHPIVICTDDTLPFRNSLIGEYAMLLAASPLGLGLAESEIVRIAQMGMEQRFGIAHK